MLAKIHPQKLLVEGNDDLHVLWSLCNLFKIKENFNIIDSKGYSNLIGRIAADLLQADLQTLGVIVDADTDITSRWNELKNRFSRQGYILPDAIDSNGLVLTQAGKPKIGIWIMPNNDLSGSVEDFIAFLIPPEDNLVEEVDKALNSIKESGKQRCKEIHIKKSYINTWLAWQETPGIPMGQAITRKFLKTENVKELEVFMNWLQRLFD